MVLKDPLDDSVHGSFIVLLANSNRTLCPKTCQRLMSASRMRVFDKTVLHEDYGIVRLFIES